MEELGTVYAAMAGVAAVPINFRCPGNSFVHNCVVLGRVDALGVH
jgi:hypothetical protein